MHFRILILLFASGRGRREAGREKSGARRATTLAETEGLGRASDPGRASELRRGNQRKAPDFSR